jgi:hypothetical protein
VLVMASSSLARDRLPALFLCAGVVTSVVVLWIGQAYVVPRYLSFLLVPLFVLLSTGASSILSRRNARPPIVRSVACLVVIAVLAFRFVSIAPDVVGLPREANRDVAEIIDTHAEPGTPVLTRVRRIQGLVFYLRRPVHALSEADAARLVCGQRTTVAYVMQPFLLEPVAIPCLSQPGVQHYRFAQYARGNEMDVWLVPPR